MLRGLLNQEANRQAIPNWQLIVAEFVGKSLQKTNSLPAGSAFVNGGKRNWSARGTRFKRVEGRSVIFDTKSKLSTFHYCELDGDEVAGCARIAVANDIGKRLF
jgi:hypothetical protein